MARGINLLTARQVATVAKVGKHSDGGGLYLLVRKRGKTTERLWMFRYKRGDRSGAKEKVLSLGPARDVSLAAARDIAGRCRAALALKQDPRSVVDLVQPDATTFGKVADEVLTAVTKGFRNKATTACWKRTLGDMYCKAIRTKPVAEVDTEDVLGILRPLWHKRRETAKRIRARIERVLDAAKAKGLRSGENPARWKGHMSLLLDGRRQSRKHHKALPWKDMPAFMAKLSRLDSISARALEWTILTVARTAMTRFLPREGEVDVDAAVWTIPGPRMKDGREHRVPLSPRCLEIYAEMQDYKSGWLFPGQKAGKPLSNMAMDKCLKRLTSEVTVHGFRSTFRDWAGDATSFPRELAEQAMAHKVGDDVETAYRRGDALERRRKMMLAWERYCLSKLQEAKVIAFPNG